MTSKSSTKYACDYEVKNIVKSFHSKCCNKKGGKKASIISGNDLNNHLNLYRKIHTHPFKKSNILHYSICNNMLRLIDHDKSNKDPQSPTNPILVSSNISSNLKVTVLVGGIPIHDTPIQKKKPHRSKETIYKENLLATYYKVPFGKLCMRQRRIRMFKISKMILAACIDRNEYRTNSQSYLESNTNLAVDILNLIDGIKECIQSRLKLKLDDFQDEVSIPIQDDRDGVITELDEQKETHKIALKLLGCSGSGNSYTRARSILANTISLPSKYMLHKSRPDIEAIKVKIMSPVDKTVNEGMDVIAELEYDNVDNLYTEPVQYTANEDETELEVALRKCSTEHVAMDAAIIKGKYKKWIELLEEKHKRFGRTIQKGEKVIVLDSIDGAEHIKSKKNITSIISFSTSILTAKWLNEREVTSGSSLNILTWQQVKGTESLYTMLPAVKDYFDAKKVLRDDRQAEPSR